MAREFIITSYLLFFKIIFNIFKLFPQKEKTTFVASFGDNVFYTATQLEKTYPGEVIILKSPNCRYDFNKLDNAKLINFETPNLLFLIKSIYHLSTSKVIFTDNYYGFLAVTKFKPNVKCVQLWHAAGAVKRFGLMDPSIKSRSDKAKNRFQKVYNRFTHVIVGSEKMADIFSQSFGIDKDRMIRTGIPRTDFFFDQNRMDRITRILQQNFPIIKNKKVILYAPTFRDGDLDNPEIALDIEKMNTELGKEYVLALRLHPAISSSFINNYPDFLIDVSGHNNINHLLLITDYLITDYSSIPFEYSLLGKPMIFFTYDIEQYEVSRGFWEDFSKSCPGPTASTTIELITLLNMNQFDMSKIKDFANEWNQYSKGNSSKNLINYLYNDKQNHSK